MSMFTKLKVGALAAGSLLGFTACETTVPGGYSNHPREASFGPGEVYRRDASPAGSRAEAQAHQKYLEKRIRMAERNGDYETAERLSIQNNQLKEDLRYGPRPQNSRVGLPQEIRNIPVVGDVVERGVRDLGNEVSRGIRDAIRLR